MKILSGSPEEVRMADQILNHLMTMCKGSVHLEPYENGREHGYVLCHVESGKAVTFSENRNSDEAVVYCCDWNDASEEQKDEAYRAANYFSTAEQAAKFITVQFKAI